jgi:uncharacterized surface anchored protein
VFNIFRSLLSRWRGSHRQSHRPSHRNRRRTVRPQIEHLEDRRTPAGSISGHAFQDLTGNGLSADDPAKAGVTVLLYRDTNHDGLLDNGDRLLAAQTTGRNGAYTFRNLAPGTYFVTEVTPRGFVRTAPDTSSYYTVDLASNQVVTGLDFDNFRLLNTRGLVSHVSFTITHADGTSLTVTNLSGQTHEGDTVTARFWVARQAEVSFVTYDTTGSTFDATTAAQDVLVASSTATFRPGWRTLTVTVPNQFYEIELVAGPAIDHFGPAGSNIFYSAQGRLLSRDNGGTAAVASVSGTVTDPATNGPVAGVQITVFDSSGTAVGQPVLTDANGNYSFAALPPGSYTVTVTNMPTGYTAQGASSTSVVLTAGENDTGINFSVTSGGGLPS